ncbi:RING-type E3 ubiquitin transferase [Malassezia japonica]|uniref:RING-type E3 ubiquitin transferase n=1 Tax=Malassezia japonica TaxID=223818 RepID=A0AAF0J9B5_9BASI|nr:RING-type E3 ubiquitin transferase [Malassezia japonica]WFD38143.1 RING-type E3 ubiquitin transferase [Malassezia japonica]
MYEQLSVYGYSGSLVSDDKSALEEEPNPRTQWPGNKIVVLSADTSYLTRPAAFGPDKTDDDGLWGRLLPIRLFYGTPDADGVTPNTGCLSDKARGESLGLRGQVQHLLGDRKRRPPKNWIALVERGGDCTFTEKVRLAQGLGAIAVIVGDAKYDEDSAIQRLVNLRDIPWDSDDLDQGETRPITMFPDGDADDIVIPSCFVIRSSYLELLELVHESLTQPSGLLRRNEEGLEVGLFLDRSLPDLSALDLGMLLLFLPSIFTVVFIVVQHVKGIVKRFRERASLRAVRNLPCYAWHADRPWERVEIADEPPTKGAGIQVYISYYLSRAMHWAMARLPGQRFAYAPVPEQPSAVALEEQPEGSAEHAPLPVNTAPAPPGVSAALDVRRYAQDVCPICLSEFLEGDRVRVLPCGHVFHQDEIDDWLTGTRRLCPTCKRDILAL